MKMNKQILGCAAAIAFGAIACTPPKTETKSTPALSTEELLELTDHPGNPIITHKYTADPATLVYNDTVYLYTGHDEAPAGHNGYVLNEWLIFKSTDLKNWEEHPVPFRVDEFEWAAGSAWAAQTIEKNGKFYWFITAYHAPTNGFAIGVAVADSPTGPFKDAIGAPLITTDMTAAPFQIDDENGGKRDMNWDDIDPTVFTDDDGQSYVFWGNTSLHYAKLKDNMIELDSEIKKIEVPSFTEAPWVHKKGDWYYLTYSVKFPEKTAYSMSKSINGPWEYKGIINEVAGNCNTNHQAILEYKGKDYFVYHNGSIPTDGGSFRRSVCIDYLYYNPDGTIKKIVMTSEGVAPVK
nr:glycoside hydrolase family 43 protein [uncultured Carboxylicivirga sp.]